MNLVLAIILLILLLLVGGRRGLKVFFTIFFNLAMIFVLIIMVGWGFNPIIQAFIICLIISSVILFILNGVSKKTIASFISVCLLLVIFMFITILFSKRIYMHGYSEETIAAVNYVNYNSGVSMLDLFNAMIIIGLIGSIIDTSIAISSALYEVYLNNNELSIKELFFSGMNIGKDILGTTTNTLFFAFLGGYMSLILYFIDKEFDIASIINTRVFACEFSRIVLCGIASFLIIPLTAIIVSILLKKTDDLTD